MAAGGEEGQAAEPEAVAEPEVEEPRSFKDLVRPGWRHFIPRCSFPRPEEHPPVPASHIRPGGGAAPRTGPCPTLSRRGGAPGCGSPRAVGGLRPGGAAGARGEADTCAAGASIGGRDVVPGLEVWGVRASAPVMLALLLRSVLLGRLPVFSVVLTCPGVFLFPCAWDTSRGKESSLRVESSLCKLGKK